MDDEEKTKKGRKKEKGKRFSILSDEKQQPDLSTLMDSRRVVGKRHRSCASIKLALALGPVSGSDLINPGGYNLKGVLRGSGLFLARGCPDYCHCLTETPLSIFLLDADLTRG